MFKYNGNFASMRKRCGVLLLVLIGIPLYAIPNYKDYIKDIPGLEAYPNAIAVNVLTEVKLDIDEDTSYTYEVFYIKKILTYRGKKRYSDVKILYNADYETVKLGECFAINQKGEKTSVPPEAVYDSEHSLTLASLDYINFREKVISFPGVEPGCFIVVHYTKTNNRKEFIDGVEHLMEENSYLEKSFVITSPKDMKLYYDYDKKNKNLKFNCRKVKNNMVYTWVIKNSSLIPKENSSPSYLYTGCPIAFSTVPNWQEMSNYFFEKFEKGIKGINEIKEESKKITKNANSKREKLFKIYDYIADNFSEKNAYISEQDFTPLPLEKIYHQKYGCARDLVALFIFMAKSIGINDCVPAIVLMPRERFSSYQKDNAVKSFMNNIVVFWNGNLITLGKNDLRFGYSGIEECNLILGKDKPEFYKYKYQSDLLTYRKIKCELNKDNTAKICYESHYFGKNDRNYRSQFRDQTEQKRKIDFSAQLKDKFVVITDGPYFKNIDNLDSTLIIQYSCDYNNFSIQQGKFIYFELPGQSIPISCTEDRKTPFEIRTPFLIREEFSIKNLPRKIKMIKPSENKIISYTFGDYKIIYKLNIEKSASGEILLVREVSIPANIIYIEQYEEFRKVINEMELPQNFMVFMKGS